MATKSKEPIRLRRRLQEGTGRTSLYLDIYLDGRRSYEYLHLYLVPEKSRADKEANRKTLALAEAIRAKRVVELQNGEFGFRDKYKEETNFYDYYVRLCEERLGEDSRGNWGNWRSCLKHLGVYDPRLRQRTFKDITPEYIRGFKDYLEREACAWSSDYRDRSEHRLSRNSRVSYFNKLKAAVGQAYEERIIATNPLRGIEGFKPEEGKRMYLTVDEVRRLAGTPCDYESIRRAFLFSCLTGLRRSDILKLTWSEVHTQGEFTRLIFKQKKTGGQEYLDITPEAAELLGERGQAEEHPFKDIHSPSCTNKTLQIWCLRAGIDKTITFHCGRHTFATMMLDLGTDIYTVSKLLGHRELTTTQIYVKVLDKNKQAAVARIPSVLGGKNGGDEE